MTPDSLSLFSTVVSASVTLIAVVIALVTLVPVLLEIAGTRMGDVFAAAEIIARARSSIRTLQISLLSCAGSTLAALGAWLGALDGLLSVAVALFVLGLVVLVTVGFRLAGQARRVAKST